MRKRIVLGIDFGTDSVRCLAVDTLDGTVLSSAVSEYPRWKSGLYCDPTSFRYRQHPLDYMESLTSCVQEIMAGTESFIADDVVGLAFDTTASTIALTDAFGSPLALTSGLEENPDAMFVLWKDHTAIEEADRINDAAKRWDEDYTRFSGGSFSCEWSWAKALHILRNAPEIREKTYSWVEHCDWIAALLTGDTTPGRIVRSRCAAGHKAMWNEQWGGLPPWHFWESVDHLLSIFKGNLYNATATADYRAGSLCDEWAARLGLPKGIAVGLGAIDCHVGAVGANIKPGVLVKVVGTSTCDIAVASRESIGERNVKGICGQVDGSVLPGLIGLEAGQAAFGDVYAWFKRVLSWSLNGITGSEEAEKLLLSRLTEEAMKLPVTENDPVALDWFNGRRSPDADPRAKCIISGLTLGTSTPMIFKTLVEATSFGSRAIVERLIEERIPVRKIVAVGGITKKSPFVMQTMADVLGMPIEVLSSEQACALGAAMFASVAAGVHKDVPSAQAAMAPGIERIYTPLPERHQIYNLLYRKYRTLTTILRIGPE